VGIPWKSSPHSELSEYRTYRRNSETLAKTTRAQEIQQELYVHREVFYQHIYIHHHIPRTHPFRENALNKFRSDACITCYPDPNEIGPAYRRYLDILKRYNGRVSRITHERFVEWQVAERKFAPAIKLIRATVFPNPPRAVNSLIIALTSTQGSLKLLDFNVDQSLSDERAAQLQREVVAYLQEKVDRAASKKGKEKAQASTSATSSKASDDEYHTPEPEFGPLGAANADERASELSALESLQRRAISVYKDLQALEKEVNLDTNEFPDQTIPNKDALLDYIAPLNNLVENEEIELEIQLPDQGPKGDNEQVEDKEADNQDNQGSDQENQVDDAEVSQPSTRAPTPELDNQNPPVAPPVANPLVNPPVAPPVANPPIPPAPPVQADDEEEMSQATYPVFDGTNPRKWLGEMEIAFTANNIQANANERRIGLAVLNSGPAKMWYIMLAAKPATWERANQVDGFKELFIEKYANDDNRAQASQLAFMRTQRLGETVGQYYNALQEQWMECGDGVIPEWMKVNKFIHGLIPAIREPVMQQAPTTIADAVRVATQCYNAFQTNVQPSHTATDTALQALMATMQELVAETKNKNNSNQGNAGSEHPQYNNNRPRNNRYQPRQRQQMTNFQCYYCGKMGH